MTPNVHRIDTEPTPPPPVPPEIVASLRRADREISVRFATCLKDVVLGCTTLDHLPRDSQILMQGLR